MNFALVFAKPGYIEHPYWPEMYRLIEIDKRSGVNRARSEANRRRALEAYLHEIGMTLDEYQALRAAAARPFHTTPPSAPPPTSSPTPSPTSSPTPTPAPAPTSSPTPTSSPPPTPSPTSSPAPTPSPSPPTPSPSPAPPLIIIPAEKVLACLVNACDVAPAKLRIPNLRVAVRASDFVTTKYAPDGNWERFAVVTIGTGAKASNQRGYRSNAYICDFRATGSLDVEPEMVEPDALLRLLEFAGRVVGIGASRKMGWGRFTVEVPT